MSASHKTNYVGSYLCCKSSFSQKFGVSKEILWTWRKCILIETQSFISIFHDLYHKRCCTLAIMIMGFYLFEYQGYIMYVLTLVTTLLRRLTHYLWYDMHFNTQMFKVKLDLIFPLWRAWKRIEGQICDGWLTTFLFL